MVKTTSSTSNPVLVAPASSAKTITQKQQPKPIAKKIPIAAKKIPTAAPSEPSISSKKRVSSSNNNENNLGDKKQKLSLTDYIKKKGPTTKCDSNDSEEELDEVFDDNDDNNDDNESFNRNSDAIKKMLNEKNNPQVEKSSFWSSNVKENGGGDSSDEIDYLNFMKVEPKVVVPSPVKKQQVDEKKLVEASKISKIIEPPKPSAPLPMTLGISITTPSSNVSLNGKSSSSGVNSGQVKGGTIKAMGMHFECIFVGDFMLFVFFR